MSHKIRIRPAGDEWNDSFLEPWLGVYASGAIESKKSPSLARKRSIFFVTQPESWLPYRLWYLKTFQNHYRVVRCPSINLASRRGERPQLVLFPHFLFPKNPISKKNADNMHAGNKP